MAGNVNVLVLQDSLSLTDRKDYAVRALKALMVRAIGKNLGSDADLAKILAGQLPTTLDVREFQLNVLDLVAATVPAVDQWRTAPLVAPIGTPYSCFQAIPSPQMQNNRIAVFFKVAVEDVPLPVSRIIFRKGGVGGNIVAVYDLEFLSFAQNPVGYFSEPVVFDPSDVFAIQVITRIATGVFSRVILGAWTCEGKGGVIA